MRTVLLGDSHLARVRRDLPRLGPDVVNAAVGGAVVGDLARQAYGAGLADADVAVLSIGTNDARRGATPEQCRSAVATLVAAHTCRWVYVRPPLPTHTAWGDAIAAAVPGRIIDTPALLASLGPRALATDGLHLSGPAYDLLLPVIAGGIAGSGWFGYTPFASAPDDAPSPEERRAAAAQRSRPATGVRRVTEDMGEDELYQSFLEFLGGYGLVSTPAPGVARLDIADDVYPTGIPPGLPLTVRITPGEFRRLCYVEHDIFDDTDPDVIPRTTTPVVTAFGLLTFNLEEDFESGLGDRAGVQPGELVYDGGRNRLRFVRHSSRPRRH